MRLGVNIDHIATVRQARRGTVPDPVDAALVSERAGATSIVCHLREDRRHIQDQDVRRLRAAITTRLNLEMSIAREIVAVALTVKPDQVTLVPERRQELTTEGGLDVVGLRHTLPPIIRAFQARHIGVSLFIDPTENQIQAARETGAAMIELHTGRYGDAASAAVREAATIEVAAECRNRWVSATQTELDALKRGAAHGRKLGLSVAAGHGLDYDNIQPIIEIGEIEELNIGFSIITRALSVGLDRAVHTMVELTQRVDELHTT